MNCRASFWGVRSERRTLISKSSLASHRHAAAAFKCFPTNESGLRSGVLGGGKNMRNSQRWRESAGFRRAMRRTAIDDREDFTPGAPDRATQECDQGIGVDAAFSIIVNRMWPREATAGAPRPFDERKERGCAEPPVSCDRARIVICDALDESLGPRAVKKKYENAYGRSNNRFGSGETLDAIEAGIKGGGIAADDYD
jgi:hypothetical protein